jgi:predicted CDP-diglyceride synthetase/phosphatidate cytidylyltransferase
VRSCGQCLCYIANSLATITFNALIPAELLDLTGANEVTVQTLELDAKKALWCKEQSNLFDGHEGIGRYYISALFSWPIFFHHLERQGFLEQKNLCD